MPQYLHRRIGSLSLFETLLEHKLHGSLRLVLAAVRNKAVPSIGSRITNPFLGEFRAL